MKKVTLHEYQERINNVIKHVNDNYSQKLSLDELAGVANFSKFHFHRIFYSITNENLGDFIKRVRLEKAAHMLLFEKKPIADIAAQTGFSSPELFTRNFTSYFSIKPKEWRNVGEDSLIEKIYKQQIGGVEIHYIDYPVRIEKLPAYKIAYINYVGKYGPQISEAYEKISSWAFNNNLFGIDTKFIGITLNNPYLTPDEKCRYYAGITVNTPVPKSPDINFIEIPSLYCAVCQYEGLVENIASAYDFLYGKWLPNSNYAPDSYHAFDIMKNRTPGQNERKVEICLPLKR